MKFQLLFLGLLCSYACKQSGLMTPQGDGAFGGESTTLSSNALQSEATSAELNLLEARRKDLSYRGRHGFPNQIRSDYHTPKGETQVTYELLGIGQAAHEYALYGCHISSKSHLEVSASILKEIAAKGVKISGSNATLVSSWFVSQVIRGALHLDFCAKELAQSVIPKILEWVKNHHLALITDSCTKNFVYSRCQEPGATNRTFALLEAEILYHHLAGQREGVVRILKDGGEYTSYLRSYFKDYDNCRPGQCETKDFDRGDGKHPAMGFQSIFKIEKIRKSYLPSAQYDYHSKLKIAAEEAAGLELQYRFEASKSSCYTGGPWESAPFILGAIGQKFSDAQSFIRSRPEHCKRPYHAWGFDLLTKTF